MSPQSLRVSGQLAKRAILRGLNTRTHYPVDVSSCSFYWAKVSQSRVLSLSSRRLRLIILQDQLLNRFFVTDSKNSSRNSCDIAQSTGTDYSTR